MPHKINFSRAVVVTCRLLLSICSPEQSMARLAESACYHSSMQHAAWRARHDAVDFWTHTGCLQVSVQAYHFCLAS